MSKTTALPASSDIHAIDFSGAVKTTRQAHIVVLATGGTIAGAAPDATTSLRYQAGAVSVQRLLDAVPGLSTLASIEAHTFAAIDSKDVSLAFWCELAQRVSDVLARDDVDGVVITHGTDTLEETAYWLDLTVGSTKPIVMTAAMRPSTALSADGPANLYNAVTLAASPLAVGQGVLIAFGHHIHSGRDVCKVSSHAVSAFASPEWGPLGWVQDGKVGFVRTRVTPHTVHSRFARTIGWRADALATVEIIASYGGASRLFVDAAHAAGVNGLVVAGTGNGSIHQTVQRALMEVAKRGVAIVRSSRTAEIRVSHGSAVDDDALGFIASGSLSPQKARILLILALSSGITDANALREVFTRY